MFRAFRHTRLVLASCRPRARCCAARCGAINTRIPRRTLKRRSRLAGNAKAEDIVKQVREALMEFEKEKWDAMPWYKKYSTRMAQIAYTSTLN
ncbi:hypothetical protein MRS44_001356 [Fusarium solani]|uniref:uncharacterized protein n=1 Tax=Fusarium solani TaxID=169388 RepID=UPI0032C46C25|nr:hypothetical protein MRS44_001356 [Fusarium solani]